MSSLAVRDKLRAWVADPAMTLPFHDTINVEANPPVGVAWCTLSFVSASATRINYCGGIEEVGTFDFIALGMGGTGDRELIAAAEHDVALLLQQIDPDHRLTLLHASPPEDFLQGGSVPWYTVSMVISYMYEQPAVAVP